MQIKYCHFNDIWIGMFYSEYKYVFISKFPDNIFQTWCLMQPKAINKKINNFLNNIVNNGKFVC